MKCPHNPNRQVYISENCEDSHDTIDQIENDKYLKQGGKFYYENETDYENSHAQNIANVFGTTEEQNQFYAVLDTLTVMQVYSTAAEPIKSFGLKDEIGVTVLYTGCIKTVAGQAWLDSFVENLSNKTRSMISVQPSTNVFKFGGGTRLHSLGIYSVLCSLAGKNIVLRTDIVKQDDLPLLLHWGTKKNKSNAVWDISTDSTYLGAPHAQMNNRLAQSGQIFSQFHFFDFKI